MKINPEPEAGQEGIEMSEAAAAEGDNNQSARPILQPIIDEAGSNHSERSANATKTPAVPSSAEKEKTP